MHRFIHTYKNDPSFREFIDSVNSDTDLNMEFIFDLYKEYGIETRSKVEPLITPALLNLDNLIEHFETKGEFEKCQLLVEIKSKL